MSDFPESGFRAAVAGLEQQRTAYRRLAALTDAQRAVHMDEDLTMLADLAGAGDDMLSDLERGAREIEARAPALGEARGPRADALRTMVSATMADGRATSAALMRLIREVRGRRELVGRELQGLDPEEPVSLVDRQG